MEKKKSMTPDEQLEMWVAGKPVHNPDRDECCPDFSCCNPELLADGETRRAFMAANEEEREKMLYDFLGKMLEANLGSRVYLGGDPTVGTCRVCGCSDLNACPGGCYWVEPDLCSVCYFEQLDKETP